VSDLKEQEEQGLYQEEVQKLVDGVVEDIRNGHVRSHLKALSHLHACVDTSWCLNGDDDNALVVLRWAKYPCALLANMCTLGPLHIDTLDDGRARFPLLKAARYAVQKECREELQSRPEYKNLHYAKRKKLNGPTKEKGSEQTPQADGQ